MITRSIQDCPKEYGRNAMLVSDFVIIRFADFEGVMLPFVKLCSIAAAPLMVSAFNASSGSIFSLMQARDRIKDMFPLGEEPGLKSLAIATHKLFSIIFLAGA